MYPPSTPNKHREWTRDGFMISTDPALVDRKALNAAFDSDFLYWAKALPEDAMENMLDMSLSFGLYAATALPPAQTEQDSKSGSAKDESKPALIGFSRLVTDNVTFAYLTDVYVLEEWRNQKLGEWLVRCVQEVLDEMPWLRRSMAILGNEKLGKWYEKHMGMTFLDTSPETHMWIIQRRGNGSAFG